NPRGLAWALPGPIIYAFYLAANARLMAHHPPLIDAGFLYGGLAAAFLGAVLWLGASLPTSAPGWLSLAFLAVGPGAVAAVAHPTACRAWVPRPMQSSPIASWSPSSWSAPRCSVRS